MTSKLSAILTMGLTLLVGSAACVNEGGVVGASRGGNIGSDAAAGSGGQTPAPDASNGTGGGSGGGSGGAPALDAAGGNPAVDAPRADDTRPATDVGAPGVDGGPITNPPAMPAGPWARGVRVGLVEAAQGVFIKVGDGATVVAPTMRNADLIEGRPIFARVHIATDAGFTARRLRAVLSLEYADKTKFEIEETKMVSGASNVEQLASTFNFTVPAANVKPNTTMFAAIYETAAAMGAEPATPPRFPATGAADLAVKAGRMELWVVVVPVGGLMDTPERRKKLEQDIYDVYPVQKVNLRVREGAVTIDGTFNSTKGFAALRTAREMDAAKPYEYYHMVITTTAVSYAGVGNVPGATANDGARRTAITITRTPNIDGNTNTTAHEIGHNHGRSHAPGCGAAGADMAYPYKMPAGDMGVNGYSLSFNAFKSRMMFRELMSYCRPRWISDYMWKKFDERVRIVTGFAPAAGMPATQMLATRSLQGFAGAAGETPDWGIVAGSLSDPSATVSPNRHARLSLGDGRQVTVPVTVTELTDHQTLEYAVDLNGADYSDGDVIEAEVVVDGARSVVPVGGLYRR